jgi:1-acyl-sn-glycerol-3-phosphate acyltransferase
MVVRDREIRIRKTNNTGLNNTNEISRAKPVARMNQGDAMLPQWAINILRPIVASTCWLFWRIRYQGRENIPSSGGLIIAANHQTYLDPFWLAGPIPLPVRFLAWNEALAWPIIGKLMRLLGAWPLQLEGSDPAAIRRSLQWLRDDGALVIFPEGGRGKADGSMIRFKGGAVRIALEAGVPILPVTIRGGHRVWPAGRRLPRLRGVEVIYHPLHEVNQMAGEDARDCARRESEDLAKIIGSAL